MSQPIQPDEIHGRNIHSDSIRPEVGGVGAVDDPSLESERFESERFESGPRESGLAETGPSESGLSDSGPFEAGLLEAGLLDAGLLEARVYAVGMVERFRGITVREGMLLRGPAGWGEFSPFAEYDAAESAPWLAAAMEAATVGWPAASREVIPVNVTVPAVGPDAAERIVRESGGCRTAKVKVAEPGQDLAADVDRVAAVRSALGPSGRVRVDANGGWSTDEAIEAIRRLSTYDLEYVEQPCRTVEELAKVRTSVDVPVAADESIRRAEDPYAVARANAADIAVLKVQPLGGVRACLRIAADIGLPVVVSSALETSVGIAAGLALAAALPELPYACGLATVRLLERDVVADPLLPVDGAIPVRRPAPPDDVQNSGALDNAANSAADGAADRDVVTRWRQRLATVAGGAR